MLSEVRQIGEMIRKGQISPNLFADDGSDDETAGKAPGARPPDDQQDQPHSTTKIDEQEKRARRLKPGGKAHRATRWEAARDRVRIAREFRGHGAGPASTWTGWRMSLVDANRKIKRHERSIRELNRRMKDFRDITLKREVRRKVDHLRGDIRMIEEDMGCDRKELGEVSALIVRGMRRGQAGQERAGRGQPAAGRLDRQEVHQPRPAVPRPDPGGQHRPDEGRGQVRVPARLQVLHLRHVVDPPGDHARDRRPGAHDPHPGAHDRDDQQAGAHPAQPGPGAGARARVPRRSPRRWTCRWPRCARC